MLATAIEYGLGLGSNLGDRLGFLQWARGRVAGFPGTRMEAASPVYETEPVDVEAAHRDEPFLNAVLVVVSRLAPAALGDALHALEAEAGRVRGPDRNAPRPLDIDILYAGGLALDGARLQVPHPRWPQRRFVVQPLADVRPELRVPGESRTVREVLFALPAEPKVVLFAEMW